MKYLPCSRHLAELTACITSFKPLQILSGGVNVICVLLMKKPELREFDSLAKGHPAGVTYNPI